MVCGSVISYFSDSLSGKGDLKQNKARLHADGCANRNSTPQFKIVIAPRALWHANESLRSFVLRLYLVGDVGICMPQCVCFNRHLSLSMVMVISSAWLFHQFIMHCYSLACGKRIPRITTQLSILCTALPFLG